MNKYLTIAFILAILVVSAIAFAGVGDNAIDFDITSPIEDQNFTSSTVTLNWSEPNLTTCFYSLDSGSYIELNTCNTSQTITITVSDGNHSIYMNGTKSGSFAFANAVINFTVNTSGGNITPTITITITNNSVFQTATPVINVTCTDDLSSGIVSEIKWNNTAYGRNTSTINNTLTSITTNSSLSDGRYTLNATCSDGALTGNSSSYNITIDTTAPVIEFTTPTTGNNLAVNRSYIDVNVSFNETNFVNLTFRLFNFTGGLLNTTVRTNRSQTIINYTNLADGEYYYNVSIQDVAGNITTTETRFINITTSTTITGIVYNSTYNISGSVNVSIYNVTFAPGSPMTETLLNSTLSNASGHFRLGIGNPGTGSMFVLKFTHNDSTGNADQIGPLITPLPFEIIRTISNTSFYTQPAATLNLSAYNGSETANISFNYIVFDNKFGVPLFISMGAAGLVNSSQVVVPRDRNYSVMFLRDPSAVGGPNATFPISVVVTNLSINNLTSNVSGMTIRQNLSTARFNASGRVAINGNTTPVIITDIKAKLMPVAGLIPPSTDLSGVTTNYTNDFNYSVQMPGSSSGIGYLVEIYANGSGEYFAGFQNITMGSSNLDLNITLYKLLGSFDNGSSYVNTSRVTFNVFGSNGDSSSNLSGGDAKIIMQHTSFPYDISYIDNQITTGSVKFAILNNSNITIEIYTNQYSPKTFSYTEFRNNSAQNLTLNTFMPESVDMDGARQALSGMTIRFMKYISSCNVANPDTTSCQISSFDENFNPLLMMSGAKMNLKMETGSGGPILYFLNIDMMRSGPPEGEASNSALSSTNESTKFERFWRFGSTAPIIYESVIVGVPYDSAVDDSYAFSFIIPALYDNNWNLLWNTSTNGTNVTLSEYEAYNSSLFTGINCSKTDANSTCYVDTSANMVWFKIPHFSGVEPVINATGTPASSSTPPSGGGGGGGGCSYNWSCTSWSPEACPASGLQTRTCTNLGTCTGTTGKPNETQSCEYVPIVENILPNVTSEEPPVKICNEGDNRCGISSVEECKNNMWVTKQSCEYGCNQQTQLCLERPELKGIVLEGLELYLYLAGLLIIVLIFGWVYYHKLNDKKPKKKN